MKKVGMIKVVEYPRICETTPNLVEDEMYPGIEREGKLRI